MTSPPNPYRTFRCPAKMISHAVWRHHCFGLSLHDVELIRVAERLTALPIESLTGARALITI